MKHILLSGVGRSGTTWCQQIINYNESLQVSFEPLLHMASTDLPYIPYFPQDYQATPSLQQKINSMLTLGEGDTQTLVKEIRCNLMLRWMQDNTPLSHLVLIVRNPLQVACSWQKLGWGKTAGGEGTDVNVIMSQSQLLTDYDVISSIYDYINIESKLESAVFVWCVCNLVASLQVDSSRAHIVYYENLFLQPEVETAKLFDYLGLGFDFDKLQPELEKYSKTTMSKRKSVARDQTLINGWQQDLSEQQIKRCKKIIQIAGLDDVYYGNGLPTNRPFF